MDKGASGDAVVWDRAIRDVNAWRGQAIQCFAQSEAAVSETLLTLAGVRDRGDRVRLRRLVGQRLQDLQDAIAPDGPFAGEAATASEALTAFRIHEPLRAVMCHGTAKIALDRKGRWIVLLKLLALRSRQAERTSMAFEQDMAEGLLCDLRSSGQRLGSALRDLRARMTG